jgi:hypothetical protein
MVLRDARMHKMVDNSDGLDGSSGTMSYSHAVPAVLQLPCRVPQKPGVYLRCCWPLRKVGCRNADMIQYWRLLTTFIYFGPLSLNLLFHIFFIQRYARMLEESAASVAHFAWLLFYAATTLLTIAPISSQAFLGTTLSSTLVYIWSRRNPDTRLSFLGLLTFKAPWLPWVLIGFNVVLHGNWPKDELCGIVVGHSKLDCSRSVNA